MHKYSAAIAALLSVTLLSGRQERLSCGSNPDRWREEIHLHEHAVKAGTKRLRSPGTARLASEREVEGRTLRSDVGQVAILDDSDGVVSRRNPFNLNRRSVRFLPKAAAYRYEIGEDTYDATAAAGGQAVELGDDDSREVRLPFAFPFFGQRYQSVFLNSDGNLTFTSSDASATDRSLGRMSSGPPRISALFRDLDPTKASGRVLTTSAPDAFVFTWDRVPEYRDVGTGAPETFQIRLYPDGKIEFAYSDVTTQEAVVGIAPGKLQGGTSVVSFLSKPSAEYSGTIAERFSSTERVDIFSAAQRFYLNHDDTYDYLVMFNNLGISADDGAVAYEVTVRNKGRAGYGDAIIDIGDESGSKKRLQALMNMGPLNQYPKDPLARVPARLSVGDTPITTLAHEAGHLFLALASVRDENDSRARPMLGGQASAHWNFAFNSEASLLEGNRIQDNGPGASPRFLTTATVEGYSPLDQYLMGFRPKEEVPDTFVVLNPRGGNARGLPRVGVAFDGDRRDIRVDEVIAAEGRRVPDHTVSQRRFRFAFILITAAGTEPSADQISQVETYRQSFERFFADASSGRAVADTALRRSAAVSSWPAVGVISGSTAPATITLERPLQSDLTILLRVASGHAQVPASVVIPAGATRATFNIAGIRPGPDEIAAEPDNADFAPTWSKVQVSDITGVRLLVTSGDKQPAISGVALADPVSLRVTDVNELPYPGVALTLAVNGGGSVERTSLVTDENGVASVRWTPGTGAANTLQASIPGGPAVSAAALGKPAIANNGVVNAASWTAGLTPGGLATVFGVNLAGKTGDVLVNGTGVPVLFAGTDQINFLVPPETATGTARVQIRTELGTSDAVTVPVLPVQPGIFFDSASEYGAVLVAGTGQPTQNTPVARGGTIEIYGTGFGPVQRASNGLSSTVAPAEVTVGGAPAEVLFSGLAPGFIGLYQINARISGPTPSGRQPLVLRAGGVASNTVPIAVR